MNEEQFALKLLADLAVDLFAVTAVLSRASRAKSIGVRYHNNEVHFTSTFKLNNYPTDSSFPCGVFLIRYICLLPTQLELAELFSLETLERLEANLENHKMKEQLYKRVAAVMHKENGYASVSPLSRVW